MPKFISKSIPLDDLYLDEQNPRFIVPPNPKQSDIINYLILNEEVEALAAKINHNKGLYAGERLIVCNENDRYVVLEGNRRLCACKILNNLRLLGNVRPASVKSFDVSQETLDSISILDVDVLPNRTFAQSALAAKHIDGIKRWSTVSKQKFYFLQYNAGKPLEEILAVTGSSKNTIKKGIIEHNLIMYALNLPFWTAEEKSSYLNLEELKVTRFTRVFTSSGPDGYPALKKVLALEADSSFKPTYGCSKEVFDQCIYLVARAAFIDKADFSTRSTYGDIPGLMDLLVKAALITKKNTVPVGSLNTQNNATDAYGNNGTTAEASGSGTNAEHVNDVSKPSSPHDNEAAVNLGTAIPANSSSASVHAGKVDKKVTAKRSMVIPPTFACSCSSSKINNITVELRELNVQRHPNACAVLLRVYLELSAKYYLTKTGKPEKIQENKLRDTLLNAINLMGSRRELTDKLHRSMIDSINKDHMITIFNGYVHYDDVHPSSDSIINYFDNFETFLRLCLSK